MSIAEKMVLETLEAHAGRLKLLEDALIKDKRWEAETSIKVESMNTDLAKLCSAIHSNSVSIKALHERLVAGKL